MWLIVRQMIEKLKFLIFMKNSKIVQFSWKFIKKFVKFHFFDKFHISKPTNGKKNILAFFYLKNFSYFTVLYKR